MYSLLLCSIILENRKFWSRFLTKRMNSRGCNYSSWNLFAVQSSLLCFLLIQQTTSATTTKPLETASPIFQQLNTTAWTVTLNWTAPRTEEIIIKYRLILYKQGGRRETIKFTDGNITTTTIDRLHPCLEYRVTLTSLNKKEEQIGKNSTLEFTTSKRVPPPVRQLSTINTTSRSLTLSWEPPDTRCNIIGYNITATEIAKEGASNNQRSNSNFSSTSPALIGGLQPYTRYNVTVTATNEEGEGENISINATTGQDVPSPPTEVRATSNTSTTITASWEEPSRHNGELGNYRVYWYKNRAWVGSENVTGHHYTIIGLSPCVDYTVIVRASTGAGEGKGVEVKTTTLGDSSQLCCSHVSTHTILMTWTKPDISWPITRYEVSWPGVDDTVNSSTLNRTISNTQGLELSQICVIALGDKERLDKTCCTTPQAHETKENTPNNESTLTVIIVGVVAALVVFSLLLGAVIKRDAIWSQLCSQQDERESASSVDSRRRSSSDPLTLAELNLLSEDDRLIARRSQQRRAQSDVPMPELTPEEIGLTGNASDMIRADNLIYSVYSVVEEYYSALEAAVKHQLEYLNDPETVATEFDLLNKESYVGETSAGELPVNKRRNRYGNISPFDFNRVRLRHAPENTTDYINASFVKSSVADDVGFIACQSPKANTVSDFWWMVWEQNIRIIVMLVRSDDYEKNKCTQYWPVLAEQSFSTLVLKTEAKEVMGGLITRTMSLINDGERRFVRHFQFISWPDFGVPNSENELLMLVKEIREHIQPSMRNIIVHCSAGVGRTGTFIALWQLQVQAERHMPGVNVRETVLELRRYRHMLVQKPEQYLFLHSCFVKYLQEMRIWRPTVGAANFSEMSGLIRGTAV